MGRVTEALWWTCSIQQFEKVATLKYRYMVKLVMKPRVFSPVARQPALTWMAFSAQIVARGLKSHHPSMKRIRSPSTELWHILAVYSMMCPYYLDLFFQSRDPEGVLNLWSLQTFSFLKYSSINCRFSGLWLRNRRCHGNHAALVGVSSPWEPPRMKLMWPPIMELWHILPA